MSRARYYLVDANGQVTYVRQEDEETIDKLLDKEDTLEGYVVIDTADHEFYHPDGEGGSIEAHDLADEPESEEDQDD